jgi:hypothetical protein
MQKESDEVHRKRLDPAELHIFTFFEQKSGPLKAPCLLTSCCCCSLWIACSDCISCQFECELLCLVLKTSCCKMLDGIDNYCFCVNVSGGYKKCTTCWALEYNACCFVGHCGQPVRSRYPNTCSCCCYFCYPKEYNARPIRSISDWRGHSRAPDFRAIQQEPESTAPIISIEDLGDQLLTSGDGLTKPSRELLRDVKLVGLYFSAHWVRLML